jgi:hypothetical protein
MTPLVSKVAYSIVAILFAAVVVIVLLHYRSRT